MLVMPRLHLWRSLPSTSVVEAHGIWYCSPGCTGCTLNTMCSPEVRQ